MGELLETRQALWDTRVQNLQGFGMHLGAYVATNAHGLPIGDVPFDVARHDVNDIDPMSFMEAATGTPHVAEVLPQRPLDMAIVVHGDQAELTKPEFYQPIRDAKRAMARAIILSLLGSTEPSDIVGLYAIGDTQDITARVGMQVKRLPSTEQSKSDARAIASVRTQGLKFVLSDFNALNFGRQDSAASGFEAIALKLNHPHELQLPPDVGRISIGGTAEVNTNKGRQLRAFNKNLTDHHTRVTEQLQAAGFAVAQVVTGSHDYATNYRTIDNQIARAVRRVAQQ